MEKIRVMVAGLSSQVCEGKMARLVAGAIASREDMSLWTTGLSEGSGQTRVSRAPAAGYVDVELVPVDQQEAVLKSSSGIDLIVDFTLPKSVNRNAEMYCEVGIPFIMGTTGGDRKALVETVEKSSISAVIATNMAVPVIVFQAMIKFAAKNFAGSFEGFKLVIEESHQATKADVSGTAVSLLGSFAALGMPLKKEQILIVRDPVVQEVKLGIPKQYLNGHAYHTYTMLSPDGTVCLQFTHNILGRNVYVDGVLKAIRFLAGSPSPKGKVFSMDDVLR